MPFVARGTSMARAIVSGSEVRVRGLAADDVLELFSVVLAVRPTFCLHRVIGVRQDGALLLMGDNTNRPDGWVLRQAVVGVAVSVLAPGATDHVPVPGPIPVPPRRVRALERAARLVRRRWPRA